MPAPIQEGPSVTAAETAYALGREKLLLFDCEGYAEAVPLLRDAIEADPRHALAHAALAETYAYWGFRRELNGQEGQSYYDLAYESAATALELQPQVSEPHRAMSVALRQGQRCNPGERQREAKSALALNPYNGENCHESWRALGSDIADQEIYRAIALCPGLISAHIDLGVALCQRDRLDEAAFHLGRAVALNPRNTLAAYDLAMVQLRQGHPAQAERLLEDALRLHPEDALLRGGSELASRELRGRPI
ncbi:MAG: tetratricopeptide repeat protein [Elusimicrobia bacterium]|nr:tetratricopeptide repeat protein [Elusimicrobiota bacterium]